jgi:hypothetical protein
MLLPLLRTGAETAATAALAARVYRVISVHLIKGCKAHLGAAQLCCFLLKLLELLLHGLQLLCKHGIFLLSFCFFLSFFAFLFVYFSRDA